MASGFRAEGVGLQTSGPYDAHTRTVGIRFGGTLGDIDPFNKVPKKGPL